MADNMAVRVESASSISIVTTVDKSSGHDSFSECLFSNSDEVVS